MVRRLIIAVVAGAALLVSGCATTRCPFEKSGLETAQSDSSEAAHGPAASSETDRFSSGNPLVMNGGGTLSDSQDPIPIFPKDPSSVGGWRNPGNPGSSPLPSTNPVASSRR